MGNEARRSEVREGALREICAAINRKDIPAAIEHFDPQIEWIEPSVYPECGTTHGLAEVEPLHERSLGTWTEGGCEPERFIVAGDKVVAIVHVLVRLNNNENWIDGRQADVCPFRSDKMIQTHTFDEPRQAFEWAGVGQSMRVASRTTAGPVRRPSRGVQ